MKKLHFCKYCKISIGITCVAIIFAFTNFKNEYKTGKLLYPIKSAAYNLKNEQKSNGSFKYEIDFITGKYSKENNIVRQAGVGYALGEYYSYSKDKKIKKTLRNAIKRYENESINYKKGSLLSYKGKASKAKIGATALALLSELQYSKTSGDNRFSDIRSKWLNGIISLYKDGAGFYSSPKSYSESPYFNGETWLALATYNKYYPNNKRVKNLLKKLDPYMMSRYSKKLDKGFFHWGLMSASKRYEATKNSKFLKFGIQQAKLYFDYRPKAVENLNSCYFAEGIGSLLIQMEKANINKDFQKDLKARLEDEMKKNRSFQIASDTIIMNGIKLKSKTIKNHKGGFRNGLYRPQSRIDFTQHCISAMIKEETVKNSKR